MKKLLVFFLLLVLCTEGNSQHKRHTRNHFTSNNFIKRKSVDAEILEAIPAECKERLYKLLSEDTEVIIKDQNHVSKNVLITGDFISGDPLYDLKEPMVYSIDTVTHTYIAYLKNRLTGKEEPFRAKSQDELIRIVRKVTGSPEFRIFGIALSGMDIFICVCILLVIILILYACVIESKSEREDKIKAKSMEKMRPD